MTPLTAAHPANFHNSVRRTGWAAALLLLPGCSDTQLMGAIFGVAILAVLGWVALALLMASVRDEDRR